MRTVSGGETSNPPQTQPVRSDRSSGHLFGLAATAVFFVMLILNAASYQ
jgi:hypothetical protein